MMFGKTEAFSSFAIDDLEQARAFYANTLGLDVARATMPGMPEQHRPLILHAGGAEILVYPKPDHAPAAFTLLNFRVHDIDAAVAELAQRGVRFEQYDGEIATDAYGIHRDDCVAIAWFRDPAGNILSVVEERG